MSKPTLAHPDLITFSVSDLNSEVCRLADRTGSRAIERRAAAFGMLEQLAYAHHAVWERRKFPTSPAAFNITARYPLAYLVDEPDEFLIESVLAHVTDLEDGAPIPGLTPAQAEYRYLQEIADVVAEIAARAWAEAGTNHH